MVELAKEKTNSEKLADLKQAVGQTFFDYGRLQYEIEVKKAELGNISINLHNLNKTCLKLQEEIDKENKELEIKLAPTSGAQ